MTQKTWNCWTWKEPLWMAGKEHMAPWQRDLVGPFGPLGPFGPSGHTLGPSWAVAACSACQTLGLHSWGSSGGNLVLVNCHQSVRMEISWDSSSSWSCLWTCLWIFPWPDCGLAFLAWLMWPCLFGLAVALPFWAKMVALKSCLSHLHCMG